MILSLIYTRDIYVSALCQARSVLGEHIFFHKRADRKKFFYFIFNQGGNLVTLKGQYILRKFSMSCCIIFILKKPCSALTDALSSK